MNEVRIISSSLTEKSNRWYVIVNYSINDGKTERKWLKTGLPVVGNKRKAQSLSDGLVQDFKDELVKRNPSADILFSDYLFKWFSEYKFRLQDSTQHDYKLKLNIIAPFFADKGVTLGELTTANIMAFHQFRLDERGVSIDTLRKYHSVINVCLNYARTVDKLIDINPAEDVNLPKRKKGNRKRRSETLTVSEQMQLLDVAKGSDIETVIYLGVFCGLRRSEAIAIRWDDIDFQHKTISICKKAALPNREKEEEKDKSIIIRDVMKNATSDRRAVMPKQLCTYLRNRKKVIERNKNQFANFYNYEYDGYVCVRNNGSLPLLDYVTRHSTKLIKQLCLKKHVTYHGLRHSYATFLLQEGVPIKTVQACMGHSNVTTTLEIYAHVYLKDKQEAADVMSEAYSDAGVQKEPVRLVSEDGLPIDKVV